LEPGAGGVLLHLDSGAYRHVNETGALIWGLLEDDPTRSELLSRVRAEVKNPPPSLDSEVGAFLAALEERSLIEIGDPPP
jgi:hypothetical protein